MHAANTIYTAERRKPSELHVVRLVCETPGIGSADYYAWVDLRSPLHELGRVWHTVLVGSLEPVTEIGDSNFQIGTRKLGWNQTYKEVRSPLMELLRADVIVANGID